MAENTPKTETKPTEAQSNPTPDSEKTNPGTPDANAYATADTAVAEAAGITEGEVKALRDDAGVNQLAGNEANTLSWESTPAGQEFLKGEKDRVKKYEDEAKAYEKSTDKGGLTEAEAKYKEAVDKARKG